MSIFGSPATANGGSRGGGSFTTGTFSTSLGDLIVVFVGYSSGAITGFSDAAGNTYSPQTPFTAGGGQTGVFYVCLSATNVSASNSVTVTLSGGPNNSMGWVYDVPITGGPPAQDVLNQNNANVGSVLSTTGSDEIVFCIGYNQTGSNFSADSGFTLDSANFQTFGGAEHNTYSSSQSLTLKMGDSSGSDGIYGIAFKAPPPPVDVAATDTFSFSDSLTRHVTAARSIADTESFSEALVRAIASHRSIADTESFNDTATRDVGFTEGVADLFTVSDSIAIVIGRFVAVNIFGFAPNYYDNQQSQGLMIYISPGIINGVVFPGQIVNVSANATTNISINANGQAVMGLAAKLYPVARVIAGQVVTSGSTGKNANTSNGIISITDVRPTTPFSFT
jgi:hypothetical protein